MSTKSRTIEQSPYFFKCMDISTGHISEEDDKILSSKRKDNPLIFFKYTYGYFIPIIALEDIRIVKRKLKEFGYSDEFIHIIAKARKHKCDYLLIDADGTTYSDIKSYNW